MAPSNFNYTVELNKGLESLKQGRLRQAEQSFKYLVDKFPGAEGGYRGLAKVRFEQEDRDGALRVLRDGAAALSKSGERSGAIGLLRQVIGLDARDLATHRRLAAALALAGDPDAAVQEYARFVRALRDNGEVDKAKNEVAYAKGQLRGVAGVSSLDEILSAPPIVADETAEADERTGETARFSDHAGGNALRPQAGDPWLMPRTEPSKTFVPPPQPNTPADDPWSAPPPLTHPRESSSQQPAREFTLENDPWSTAAPSAATSWPPSKDQEPAEPAPGETPSSEAPSYQAPSDETPQDASFEKTVAPESEPAAATEAWSPEASASANGEPTAATDPEAVEAAAARYLATRDPRAAGMALEAARHYIKEGHTDAASDLLLQLIAAGVADHDAQRLLIDVARTLGKREVAKAKCQLLVQALLLDGRNDLAEEVEALALAD
jgi:thioredoxin-like negative regulator of GroEL